MFNCFSSLRTKPLVAYRDFPFQPVAPLIMISELARVDKKNYEIINRLTGLPRRPHGVYIFVIPLDDPECIRLMPYDFIYGHASLMQTRDFPEVRPINYDPAPVCYAGQVCFCQGEMVWWNNGSGHYEPPKNLRHRNLSHAAHKLLPDSKFRNYTDQ